MNPRANALKTGMESHAKGEKARRRGLCKRLFGHLSEEWGFCSKPLRPSGSARVSSAPFSFLGLIPNSARPSGEHTRPACGGRRPADRIEPFRSTGSRPMACRNSTHMRGMARCSMCPAGRPAPHAGRMCSPESCGRPFCPCSLDIECWALDIEFRSWGHFPWATQASFAASSSFPNGLERKPSMPAARHRSRSPGSTLAVNAMIGT